MVSKQLQRISGLLLQCKTWLEMIWGTSLSHYGEEIVAIASVLIALSVIYRYIVAPFYKGVNAFIDRQHRIMNAVHWVELELKPNGGGSLRDAVDKIVKCTEIMTTMKEGSSD